MFDRIKYFLKVYEAVIYYILFPYLFVIVAISRDGKPWYTVLLSFLNPVCSLER